MRHTTMCRVLVWVSLCTLLLGCARPHASEAVVIGVRTASDHVPFYVAERHQLYRQHGLDVTVRVVGSNTEIVEALQRGDFQVGVVPVSTAIAAIAQGSRTRIVAMTGRGGDGLLVRQEGPTTLAELRGKRVGTIRASILEVLLRKALAQEHLDAVRDVEVVFLTTLGDLLTALKTGQLEAISCTEPFLTAAEHEGWGRVLARYTTAWPDHPCCVVLAADAWAARSPDALRGVLAVHCQATDWSNEHLDEAAQIIVDTLQTFTPAMVRASLDPTHMRVDYLFTPDEIERMAHLMVEQGLINHVPPRDRLTNPAPLDSALRVRP